MSSGSVRCWVIIDEETVDPLNFTQPVTPLDIWMAIEQSVGTMSSFTINRVFGSISDMNIKKPIDKLDVNLADGNYQVDCTSGGKFVSMY